MWIKEYEKPNTYSFTITLTKTKELIGGIDVVGYINGCPEIGYCLYRNIEIYRKDHYMNLTL